MSDRDDGVLAQSNQCAYCKHEFTSHAALFNHWKYWKNSYVCPKRIRDFRRCRAESTRK
jgi:hypothetical protein